MTQTYGGLNSAPHKNEMRDFTARHSRIGVGTIRGWEPATDPTPRQKIAQRAAKRHARQSLKQPTTV
jgi:hypothetical protein